MYEQIARFWTEALFIRRRLGRESWRRYVQIENEHTLRALADSRRGCVFATAYYGNIAVAAVALGHVFRPIHIVVDWLAEPNLASWQRELYAQPHVRPIDRRMAAAVIPKVLSEGGAVLMVGEHERHRGRGVPTRFLGKMLNCYPTLGRLARWYDVPIAVVTCRRETTLFNFTLALHDVIERESAGMDDGDVVRRTMAALECAVMQAPEQYLWSVTSVTSPQRSARRGQPDAEQIALLSGPRLNVNPMP